MMSSSTGASTSASVIQPVTRRFPAHDRVQEHSHLPFSVVITPLAGFNASHRSPSSRSNVNVNVVHNNHCIKCPHCGAPHVNDSTCWIQTQSLSSSWDRSRRNRSSSTFLILCYLCGRTSSHPHSHYHVGNNQDELLHSSSSSSTTVDVIIEEGEEEDEEDMEATNDDDDYNKNHTTAALHPPPDPLLSRSSFCNHRCLPTVWWVVLDGSATSPHYWRCVSSHLLRVLNHDDVNPNNDDENNNDHETTIVARRQNHHVHMALLVTTTQQQQLTTVTTSSTQNRRRRMNHSAPRTTTSTTTTTTTLGVWQLASPVPHVVYYHHHHHFSSSRSSHKDHAKNKGGSSSGSFCHGLDECLMEAIVSVSIQQNRTQIAAALRSLVDYRPPPIPTPPASSPTFASASPSTTTTTTTVRRGADLEGTIQCIVGVMGEVGRPWGGRHALSTPPPPRRTPPSPFGGADAAASYDSCDYYAGGKILVLLARPSITISMAAMNHRTNHHPTATTTTERYGNEQLEENDDVYIGSGGSGGRIGWNQRNIGERFQSTTTGSSVENVETRQFPDWDPQHLNETYPPEPTTEWLDSLADLGRACASAALGVDLLVLTEEENDYDDDHTDSDFGLCWYAPLALKSGAPGPLMFRMMTTFNMDAHHSTTGTSTASAAAAADAAAALFQRELQSRVPWKKGMVFNGALRIRLSPGFALDDSPAVERIPSLPSYVQLARHYAESGWFGPGCSTVHGHSINNHPYSSIGSSSTLWRLGVCDPYTTVAFDVRFDGEPIASMDVRNYGDYYDTSSTATAPATDVESVGTRSTVVAFPPVLQMCFAYTTLIPDNDSGDHHNASSSGRPYYYKTVRHMRIHSLRVGPLCTHTEDLYASLNPEALAAVLLHKLALVSFQQGIRDVPAVAQDWLQMTLVRIYRSAERFINENPYSSSLAGSNRNNIDRSDHDDDDENAPPTFFPHERLLDHASLRNGHGDLSIEQVLLAQGHDRLRSIPLMTFLLLNCDALRYGPTRLDWRCAALNQMLAMPPSSIARCIAPRIQLWSVAHSEVEPILDVVDLRAESLTHAVYEYSPYDLVLLIDTPHLIAVVDAQYWLFHSPSRVTSAAHTVRVNPSSSLSPPAQTNLPWVLGPALKRAVMEAARSYRTPPVIVYELNYIVNKAPRVVGLILDLMVEDASIPTTDHVDFNAWKANVATAVQRELKL